MMYELRTYRCLPGRLPALLQRFEKVTLPLWTKHGIRQSGFWTTLVGPSHLQLIYLLAWNSMAERESKWNAFQADPDWKVALAKSEEDGRIVENVENAFLQPTSFSALQ